jgi:hypothetical protein
MMVNAEPYYTILIPVNGSIFVGELITLFLISVVVLSVIWYGVKGLRQGFRQGRADARARRAALGLLGPFRQGRANERARRALPRAQRPGFFESWRKLRAEQRAIWQGAAQPRPAETPPAASDPPDDSWRI